MRGCGDAAEDLRPGDDRRHQTGDLVRLRVAVELEQVGLKGVEGVDADAAGEEGLDHQPFDRGHAPAVLDRGRCDLSHLGQRATALLWAEPDVVHELERHHEHDAQDHAAEHERHAKTGLLGDEASRDRAAEHRRSRDHLAAPEHRLHVAAVAGGGERVDQPRFDSAGEERESEAEQQGDNRPLPERRLDLPEHDVEQRRRRQRQRAEQVRRTAPDGVGDDPGRHLEQHHPGREERVCRERLQVGEPRVEKEDRVDPPDERRRQRVPEQEQKVGALYGAGRGHIRSGLLGCNPQKPQKSSVAEAVLFDDYRSLSAYQRSVRGSPKCRKTPVSANQVIAATASPSSVSTISP